MLGIIDDLEGALPTLLVQEAPPAIEETMQIPERDFMMQLCSQFKRSCTDRYTRGVKLGQGTYGYIYVATDNQTGTLVQLHFVEMELNARNLRVLIAGSKLKGCRLIARYFNLQISLESLNALKELGTVC